VLILLPPSESKTRPEAGPVLDVSTMSLPELTDARDRMLDALVRLSSGNASRARKILKLTVNQDSEVQRNAVLRSEPVAPALDVFTGVLFTHLAADELKAPAQKWLQANTLIASGLFGFVYPSDNIPAYRLAADVTLPKLGGVASYWRKHLDDAMADRADESIILDCRSQQYALMWQPGAGQADQLVTTRVLQRTTVRGESTLKIVSHHNKATKGLLVHALAQSRVNAKTAPALQEAVRDLGFECFVEPTNSGAWRLDVITEPLPLASGKARPE
jgi:cytoplasmic iron level regulating protein YaaA (DUF328/UPF0246 family)